MSTDLAAAASGDAFAPFASPFEDVPLPRARVLIVDDDEGIRDTVSILVSKAEREIVACATGAEALERLREQPFDLALLDIRLPDMTGLDILKEIRTCHRDTAVVLVSGDDSIESAIAALRLGAREFIRKPYEPHQLQQVVDNALNERRLERENSSIRTKLEASERLHRYLVEHSPDLIYMLDQNGSFRYVNDRFTQLLGYSRRDLIGTHFSRLVHEEDHPRARLAFNERRTGPRATCNVEMRLRRSHAAAASSRDPVVTVVVSATGVYLPHQVNPPSPLRFLGTYGAARDISDRKRVEETVAYHAFHDSLTGLPNRLLFRDRLGLAIAQAERRSDGLAVLFVDLDRFKLVNDTYGHVRGDQLLQQVALRLRHCLRTGDTLSRLGGDEFTLVVPGISSPAAAEAVARKILDSVIEPFSLGEFEFNTTASIGVALYPDHGVTEDELIRHADLAMYQVKRRGKNGIALYESGMSEASGSFIGVEHDLRRALRRDEMEVHYQPVIDTSSGIVDQVEALVRWRHPSEGLLDPSHFMHIAEETGLVHDLDTQVMEKSFLQLAIWRAQGLEALGLAINVSARDFERDDFVTKILKCALRHGLPPSAIELEITESVLIEDIDAAVERVRELRRHGVRVSIDDFGTRYSSLGYLQRLPVNTIKIDQLFVKELSETRPQTSIVSAIVSIARGFGFDLIAEGVEQQMHLAQLSGLGCTRMQGFLFSKAEPADVLTPYLLGHQGLPA